jgi:hypothetical protein
MFAQPSFAVYVNDDVVKEEHTDVK